MSTDDRGDSPRGSAAAEKDELQRAVEEKTARAAAVAGSEPIVNAAPAKKAAKRTTAKKAAPAKAPAARKAPAAKKAPAVRKAPAKRAVATAEPVVAPVPIAEGGLSATTPSAPVRSVTADDLRAVVEGWSHDPHAVLGAHRTDGGWVVRTLRPDAVAVTVVDEDGARYEARQVEDGGIHEANLPQQPGDYRVDVAYADGEGGISTYTIDDPYRWMPTVGELDEHLIREGRHELLWEVLGAHVRRYETPRGQVAGVSFAVWAPNARGVKVTGDFESWEARVYPMRSLGSSGVWEIFIPDVPVGTRYRFHVLGADGTWREKSDPLAFATEVPPLNASVVTESTYSWADEAWLADRAAGSWHERPMSAYEVHLGSWRPGLGYRELA